MKHLLTGSRLRTLVGSEELDYTLLKSILGDYKQPRNKISKWLADGTLIRVKKGLYVFGKEEARGPYCTEGLANIIYGPSAISLEYALSFYGIIPERAEHITSITPKRNKLFETPVGTFTYHHLHLDKYSMGITRYEMDKTHPIFIATPEKAMADYFYYRCRDTVFQTRESMLSFLSESLRVDNEMLLTFNISMLKEIQAQYKLSALEWIIEIIEKGIRYE